MSFQHGAGFRIVGAIVRKFVNDKGTFGAMTLDVVAEPRAKKIEVRAFDAGVIEEIGGLGAGQTIEVTGSVDVETVKGKDRKEVIVDGRSKWVAVLTDRAIKVEGASAQPRSAAAEQRPRTAPLAKPRAGWDENDEPPF